MRAEDIAQRLGVKLDVPPTTRHGRRYHTLVYALAEATERRRAHLAVPSIEARQQVRNLLMEMASKIGYADQVLNYVTFGVPASTRAVDADVALRVV